MSDSGSPSRTPTGLESRRSSVVRNYSDSSQKSARSIDGAQEDTVIAVRPTPRATLNRHFTTLQEHADALRGAQTLGGSGDSPKAEERREGFTWDMPRSKDARGVQADDLQPAQLTKGSTYDARGEVVNSRNGSTASSGTIETRHSRHSWPKSSGASPSPPNASIKRQDTMGSFDFVDRNARRHAPDLRMFGPEVGKPELKSPPPKQHVSKLTKAGRALSTAMPPARKNSTVDEKPSKRVQISQEPPKQTDAPQIGLKERRKLGQVEGLRLTLPTNIPDLPARGRAPISEEIATANFHVLGPPRPRSPKTPWAKESAAAWLPTDFAPAPSTIAEAPEDEPVLRYNQLLPDDDTIDSAVTPMKETPSQPPRNSSNQPRFKRGRSQKSEASTSRKSDGLSSPATVDEDKTEEQLKEIGKRSRRWRWSGPWTSSDLNPVDSEHPENQRGSFRSKIWNPLKRRISQSSSSTGAPSPIDTDIPLIFRRKPSDSRPADILAKIPLPPIFVPPEVIRVPTPPMFDEHGEVKEGLSNFFFDMQDGKRPKASPGGFWDSDAILMSQKSNITPTSNSSEESPNALSVQLTPLPPVPNQPSALGSPSYMSAFSPHQGPDGWFRISSDSNQTSKSKEAKEAEERAKFEWLIPEHYPNSPLCPLHHKYRGPSQGLCYFHGRREDGFGIRMGGQSDLMTPPLEKLDIPKSGRRKRRLISLSSP